MVDRMDKTKRKIRIPPLEDCHLRAGCYQPADKETIEWRIGWRNGFVRKWNALHGNCADQRFADREGWEEGSQAGKRDATNKCPTYPHPKRKRESCPTPFRVAWRLGWYEAYFKAGDCGDKTKHGSGYGTGTIDADEFPYE